MPLSPRGNYFASPTGIYLSGYLNPAALSLFRKDWAPKNRRVLGFVLALGRCPQATGHQPVDCICFGRGSLFCNATRFREFQGERNVVKFAFFDISSRLEKQKNRNCSK